MLLLSGILFVCVSLSSANPRLDQLLATRNASTFVSLLQRAGLGNVLTDTVTPHTLIVPTDAAFAKLSRDRIEALANNDFEVTNVMEYHIVNGEVFSWDLTTGVKMISRNKHVLRVYASTSGRTMYINNARVVEADLQASNGLVYMVNDILDVPEGTLTDVLDTARYNTTIFERLTEAAGLLGLLNSTRASPRFTVFAPTNAAMQSMDQAFLARISSNQYLARMLAEYHIVRGTLHMDDIQSQTSLTTLLPGHSISITPSTANPGNVIFNRVASLVLSDIEAEDGVMHTISHVLIPSNLAGLPVG